MALVDQIVALKDGSPELETVRASAVSGDPLALKKYVYFCLLRDLRADRFLTPRKRIAAFRKLVNADAVEVKLVK